MKIVVLEVAGLHAGYLGCYGNDWIATPNLDRLAAEGIVGDLHYLDEIPSAPLGRLPQANADHHPLTALPHQRNEIPALSDFAAAFLAAITRWQTTDTPLLWLDGPDLAPPWHLSADLLSMYFDEEDDAKPWPHPPAELDPHDTAALFRLQNTYAAVVTAWDAQLGAALDTLRDHGTLDTLVFCLTSRTGLALGEHGAIGASTLDLHDENAHVPLLWRFPQQADAGVRVAALTQPADLHATLADLLGSPTVHGHSLRPLFHAEIAALRPHALTTTTHDGQQARLLRTLDWALLLPPDAEPKLYVKPDDRWEVNNVAQHYPGVVEDLQAILHPRPPESP